MRKYKSCFCGKQKRNHSYLFIPNSSLFLLVNQPISPFVANNQRVAGIKVDFLP